MPEPVRSTCANCGRNLVELDTVATDTRVTINEDSWYRSDLSGDHIIDGPTTYRKSWGHKLHSCKPREKKAGEPSERMKEMLK